MKQNKCKCGKRARRGFICDACAKAAYRARHPFLAGYQNLKDSAKRRGKQFDLTYEQYVSFVTKTEYYKNKGKKATSLHIDRIDESKGYTIDNLQVITNSENIRKYLKFRYRDENNKPHFWVFTDKPILIEETPF